MSTTVDFTFCSFLRSWENPATFLIFTSDSYNFVMWLTGINIFTNKQIRFKRSFWISTSQYIFYLSSFYYYYQRIGYLKKGKSKRFTVLLSFRLFLEYFLIRCIFEIDSYVCTWSCYNPLKRCPVGRKESS